MEIFWTIVVIAFVVGMAALGGFVGFYWLIVIPERELHASRPVGRG